MADELFPEGFGSVLQNIFGGGPGAPGVHTHTFNLSPTEYDDDDEPIPQPLQPTMTITRTSDREQGAA